MKSKIWLPLVILAILASLLSADDELNFLGDDVIPPSVHELLLTAPRAEDYPEAKACWILKREDITLIDDSRYEKDVHYLIKLFTYRGRREYSNFKFIYDTTFQQIEILQARSINPTEDSMVFRASPIPTHSVNEITPPHLSGAGDYVQRKELVLSLPEVSESSFVEIKVRFKNVGTPPYPFGGHTVIVDEDPVLNAKYSIIHNDNRIRYETANGLDNPLILQDTIRWEMKNYRGLVLEEGLPPASEFLPVITKTTQLTWTDVASSFAKLFLPRAIVTEQIREVTNRVTEGKSGEEAIWAISNWVADEINTVRISLGQQHYTPNDAERVLNNGRGDCRDLSTLILAMLKAKDIEAHPVLVNRRGSRIRENIPTIAQFDHIIVRATHNGEHYYIDPYLTNAPNGSMGVLSGERGFLVRTGGQEFINLPEEESKDNRLEVYYDGRLDKDGTLKGTVRVQSYGMMDGLVRSQLRDRTPRRMKMVYEDLVSNISSGARLLSDTTGIVDDRSTPIWFELDFEVKEFASLQKDMMVMQFPLNPALFASIDLPSSMRERKFPYFNRYPAEVYVEHRLQIPTEYKVVHMTNPVRMNNAVGTFIIDTYQEGEELVFSRELKLPQRMISAEKSPQFIDILRAYRLPKNRLLLLEEAEGQELIRPIPTRVPMGTRSAEDFWEEK